jgi:hypothetical protein
MPLSSNSLAICPAHLNTTVGIYVIDPGYDTFIILSTDLDPKTARKVYIRFLEHHLSLPPEYRLFPMALCYEDLPDLQPAPLPQEASLMLSTFTRSPGSGLLRVHRTSARRFRVLGG